MVFAAIALTLLIFLIHILTHFPFFDESIRARFLWLMSSGLKPNIDFFTPHPSMGYLLSLPFMNILPVSAYTLLALRFLSLFAFIAIGALFCFNSKRISNDWSIGLIPFLLVITAPAINNYCAEYSIDHLSALFAFCAFCLLFSQPTKFKLALLPFLCLVSLLIMPKYQFPLFFGSIGFIILHYRNNVKATSILIPLLAGTLVTFFCTFILFRLNGLSIFYDIDHSHLLHARLASSGSHNVMSSGSPSTMSYTVEHLMNNKLLAVVIMAGIAGWATFSAKQRSLIFLPAAGILLGTLVSSFTLKIFFEQYVTPILLCLALFAPYMLVSLKSTLFTTTIRITLISLTIITLLGNLREATSEFKETPYNGRGNTKMHQRILGNVVMVPPGISKLAEYERLLAIIPSNETVAAVWPNHPMFRKDPTFITFDDIPTHALGLKPSDPLIQQFNAETYRAAITKTPPAFISPAGMEVNYPPGWLQVTLEFLALNQHRYTPFADGYLRTDLLPRQYNIQ